MSIERSVIQKILSLTPDQQREVMEFVETLQKESSKPQPRRSLMGLFSDLDVHITEDDIEQARREMWGNFPREDI
jgi:putative lipoic acid-binding regulatory protein